MSQSMDLRQSHRYGEHTVNHRTNSQAVPGQQTPIIGYVQCTVFIPTILPGVIRPLPPNQLSPCPIQHFPSPTLSSGQTLIQNSSPMNSLETHPRAPITQIPVVEGLNPSENSAAPAQVQAHPLPASVPSQNLPTSQAAPSIDIFVPSRTTDASRSPRQSRESSEQSEVLGSPASVSSSEDAAGQARESSEQNETMESSSSLSSSERAAISETHTKWLEESVIYTAGAETFPMRLHRLLAELELTDGGTSIAAFHPNGRSFLINDKKQLLRNVMPKFFPKMKSYPSFQRQLNLYNFKRTGGLGRNRSSYHHRFFIKASPAMSILMKPIKLKRGPAFFSNKKYPPRKLRASEQPGAASTDEEE